MTNDRDPRAMQTVGDKVAWLRERLAGLPVRSDCVSFTGTQMPALGNSIFPANLGLEDPARERISTFLLGSDWGNEVMSEAELAAKKYARGPFLSGAHRMLKRANFDVRDVWYSNAWPVLRAGNSKAEGHHPMRDDSEVTNEYREYLELCIEILDPKLIIATGFACAWFMGPLIGDSWRCGLKASSELLQSADIDIDPARIGSGLVFVAATHPSRPSNERHRKFKADDLNETGLLVRARRMAGIPEYAESVQCLTAD